jgi:O-antigen ligase
LLLAFASQRNADIAAPWPVIAIVAIPALQLVPLGTARTWLWPAWRQELSGAFAALGIDAPSSISIYPYATLRNAITLAGCCALFVLLRAAARRFRSAVAVAVAVLILVSAEAALGLLQALSGLPPLTNPDVEPAVARGTFVNRNHFAVLLEAGFCLALGLGALTTRPEGTTGPAGARYGFAAWGCWLAAALCLAGVAASGSRMGILVLIAAALAGSLLFRESAKRRVGWPPLTFAALALVATLSFAGSGRAFEKLLEEKGEPGRLAIWSDTLAAAERHIAAGSGLGTFAYAFQRRGMYFPRNTIDHAHSDWLEFLVELGLAGAVVAALSISGAFVYCLRRRKRNADPLLPMQDAFLLGAGAILLHSTVDFPLQIPSLAALFAVMLGSAVGVASRAGRIAQAAPAARAVSAIGCCSLAFLAALVASGRPRSWNAESLFAGGQSQLLAGRPDLAGRGFENALRANPYAALAWQKRAEAARMNGHGQGGHKPGAREFLEMASQVEPFTFRTEWPAAVSLLRRQSWDQAAVRFRRLAAAIPDVRPAIFRAALEAGMPAMVINESMVPEGAAAQWLRTLADRETWADFERSLSLRGGTLIAAPAGEWRYLFDRLFQARQQRLMKILWRAAQPANSFDAGFGFQWVAHEVRNVHVRAHPATRSPGRIELDFRATPEKESVHLSHYFPVAPASGYVLEYEIRSAGVAGGEVRLEVWSPRRMVASSATVRDRKPRQTELSFRTGAFEEVLQLRVVSRRTSARGTMSGRFFLEGFQLRPAHGSLQNEVPVGRASRRSRKTKPTGT